MSTISPEMVWDLWAAVRMSGPLVQVTPAAARRPPRARSLRCGLMRNRA